MKPTRLTPRVVSGRGLGVWVRCKVEFGWGPPRGLCQPLGSPMAWVVFKEDRAKNKLRRRQWTIIDYLNGYGEPTLFS